MELQLNVAAEKLVARFDALESRLKEMPQHVPEELTAWQVEDVHRRYPDTEVPSPDEAFTLIPRRSRLESKWRRPRLMRMMRRHPGARRIAPAPRSHPGRRRTTAPILRPELFDMLCARMRALLLRTIRGH